MSNRVIQFPTKLEPVASSSEKYDLTIDNVLEFCNKTIEDFSRLRDLLQEGKVVQEVLDVMSVYSGFSQTYSEDLEETVNTDLKILDILKSSDNRDCCLEILKDVDLFLSLESVMVLKALDTEKEARLDEANEFIDLISEDFEEDEEEDVNLCQLCDMNLCSPFLTEEEEPKPKEKVVKLKNKLNEDREDAQDALIEVLGDLLDEAKNNELTRFMFIKGDLESSLRLECGVYGRWLSVHEMAGAALALQKKIEYVAVDIDQED